MADEIVVFGYVAEDDSARERIAGFAVAVSKLANLEVATCRAHTYTELTELLHKEKVDLAWLPPIPFMALARHDRVVPLVSLRRAGHSEFYSVLIVQKDSAIRTPLHLVRKRAAWVDPHSASGYVLPRIALAAVGVDPRTAFATEKFYASHDAVVRAVLSGHADFGATFADPDEKGTVARGAWLDVPDGDTKIRVLATFGAIPGDVMGARVDVPAAIRERFTRALILAAKDADNRLLLRDLFGVDEFRRGAPPGYDEFREATMRASSEGLLEGDEKS
jgi:phosphonate transport system substrate-binding protein